MYRNPPPANSSDTPENRRNGGRMRIGDLECSFGELLDISATGLRVRRGGLIPAVPGRKVKVVVGSHVGMLKITCQVMRSRRVGLFGHEVGLRFVDLTDEGHELLSRIAREAPVVAEWELRKTG